MKIISKMNNENNNELLFIIPRYIVDISHSGLWIEQYLSIRKFYSDAKIIYIDNGSKKEFLVDPPFELVNCDILKSEVPESRLFSTFYYFIKYYSHYKTGIFLHDGFFFHRKVDFSDVKEARFFWHFTRHDYDNKLHAKEFFSKMNNTEELYKFYLKKKWLGCLGCMIVMKSDFLMKLQDKYNLINMVDSVNHLNTCEFERTIGCMSYFESEEVRKNPSFFGHCGFMKTTSFDDYMKRKEEFISEPVIKIFNTRLGLPN